MKAWKVYAKYSGVCVNTVWYDEQLDAFDVKEAEDDSFDFEILVKEVQED